LCYCSGGEKGEPELRLKEGGGTECKSITTNESACGFLSCCPLCKAIPKEITDRYLPLNLVEGGGENEFLTDFIVPPQVFMRRGNPDMPAAVYIIGAGRFNRQRQSHDIVAENEGDRNTS
jgi:hypothetical protein